MNISELVNNQKHFFKSQQTKDIDFRLKLLKALKDEILSREKDIYNALQNDFNKPPFETFISEFGLVISELNLVTKNLKKWTRPKRIKSSLLTFPSRDFIYKEPYGTILIMGPWNYPFLLTMEPVIMAIAAGNTAVLKPSELTKHTSRLVQEILEKIFKSNHVVICQGGVDVAKELLDQKWDYIFFTGSVRVGKIIAKAAAKNLTPVTLELGGKTPCIIDDTIDLNLVSKRIVWGKLLNYGQTCISPDYILVKKEVKDDFIRHIKIRIIKAYGENPQKSKDLPRVINQQNFLRLKNLLKDVDVVFGGDIDESDLYIAPTLVNEPAIDSALMSDEIFGPILPILTYDNEKDIEKIIWSYEKPLSLYVFSMNNKFVDSIISKYNFGGGVINDTLVHFGNHRLPFGGVGASGMGAYHGKLGFDTFSHEKSIIKRGTWTDPPVRYAPYKGKLKLMKKMFKWFG